MVSRPTPSSPITEIPGIGPGRAKKLSRLGLETIRDLLHHYPSRYLDYTKRLCVKDLSEKQDASLKLVLGEPKRFTSRGGKLITSVTGSDATGKIKLIWFNNPYINRLIIPGQTYLVAGRPSFFGRELTLVAPVVESAGLSNNASGLVPIYPLTEGITSTFLRSKIKQALNLSELPSYSDALWGIHFPKNQSQRRVSDQRLALNYHLQSNITSQIELLSLPKAVIVEPNQLLYSELVKKLPFTLTKSQEKAISNCFSDLSQTGFTHRLIQGETGSGKTIIAFFIAALSLAAGKSFCLLAPTEILARQHFETFQKLGLGKKQVLLVTANTPLAKMPNRPVAFIGTHALLNQIGGDLLFPVSAVVIDEQHRFGVHQRETLLQRKPLPHLFNFTATPIPRTLALGIFGEVSISTLTEKPKDRLPIKTWLVSKARFQKSTPWLEERLATGGKIFAVAPVIDHDESKTDIENVKKIFIEYQKKFSGKAEVFLIHGQMKSADIRRNLMGFAKAGRSILVSTSMIEVGVDIPDADVIIIHSAGNFGLATLHQLRGRVGRNHRQGYCLLIGSDESQNERLELMAKYDSGLTLSKMDLRLRGAGELFGTRQHGRLPVRLRSFWDKKVFQKAKGLAKSLVATNPKEALAVAERLANW